MTLWLKSVFWSQWSQVKVLDDLDTKLSYLKLFSTLFHVGTTKAMCLCLPWLLHVSQVFLLVKIDPLKSAASFEIQPRAQNALQTLGRNQSASISGVSADHFGLLGLDEFHTRDPFSQHMRPFQFLLGESFVGAVATEKVVTAAGSSKYLSVAEAVGNWVFTRKNLQRHSY